MLKKDYIIDNSFGLRKPIVSGVYFLISKGSVVYVGSSVNCHERIECHRRGMMNKRIKFDSYFIEEIDGDYFRVLEMKYIKEFRPKYNVVHNNDTIIINENNIFPSRHRDCKIDVLKKLIKSQ